MMRDLVIECLDRLGRVGRVAVAVEDGRPDPPARAARRRPRGGGGGGASGGGTTGGRPLAGLLPEGLRGSRPVRCRWHDTAAASQAAVGLASAAPPALSSPAGVLLDRGEGQGGPGRVPELRDERGAEARGGAVGGGVAGSGPSMRPGPGRLSPLGAAHGAVGVVAFGGSLAAPHWAGTSACGRDAGGTSPEAAESAVGRVAEGHVSLHDWDAIRFAALRERGAAECVFQIRLMSSRVSRGRWRWRESRGSPFGRDRGGRSPTAVRMGGWRGIGLCRSSFTCPYATAVTDNRLESLFHPPPPEPDLQHFRSTRLSSDQVSASSAYWHVAYLTPYLLIHLSPFAMCPAFPDPDYYEDSVAVGLAPVRRSRGFRSSYVRAWVRPSTHPYARDHLPVSHRTGLPGTKDEHLDIR